MSDYQASKELARKTEIVMLEQDCDYMCAQAIVLKRHPELLKQYTQEIIGE